MIFQYFLNQQLPALSVVLKKKKLCPPIHVNIFMNVKIVIPC